MHTQLQQRLCCWCNHAPSYNRGCDADAIMHTEQRLWCWCNHAPSYNRGCDADAIMHTVTTEVVMLMQSCTQLEQRLWCWCNHAHSYNRGCDADAIMHTVTTDLLFVSRQSVDAETTLLLFVKVILMLMQSCRQFQQTCFCKQTIDGWRDCCFSWKWPCH